MDRRLHLFGQRPFPHPTRFGPAHYVPVLKTLRGEMNALSMVAPAALDRMTPLIEVQMGKGADDPPRSSSLPRLPQVLGLTLRDRPFFLDFRALTARQKVFVGQGKSRRPVPAVEHVIDACDQRALNFVPVVGPGLDDDLTVMLKEIASEGRGACLRLPVTGVFTPIDATAELMRMHEAIGTEPAVTDIIVDLRYIEPDPGFEARDIVAPLRGLAQISDWRSVILIGSVIPETLSGFAEDQISRIHRYEWQFWNELRSEPSLRPVTFGDYAIQNPVRPQGGGPGMRANLRYNTPETLLIARGRSIQQHGNQQYRQLCAELVQQPEFRGNSYSWGDALIVRCAEGLERPGNQERWRGAGTSHHLEVMIEALSKMHENAPQAARSFTCADTAIAELSMPNARP